MMRAGSFNEARALCAGNFDHYDYDVSRQYDLQ